MSRHRYPVEQSRAFERTTKEKMLAALECAMGGNKDEFQNKAENGNEGLNAPNGKHGSHRNTKTKQATLKVVLGEALGYGPALSEHILLDAGLTPSTKVCKDFKLDDDISQLLVEAVTKFEDWLTDVIVGEKIPEGYILMQQKTSGKNNEAVAEKGTSEQMVIDTTFLEYICIYH